MMFPTIPTTLSTRFGSNVNRKVALQKDKGNLRVGYTGAKFIVNYMFWGEAGYDAVPDNNDHKKFKK